MDSLVLNGATSFLERLVTGASAEHGNVSVGAQIFFQEICPDKAGTLKTQATKFQRALTTVAFVQPHGRKQLSTIYQRLRRIDSSFVPFYDTAHSTVLSILHDDPVLSDQEFALLIDACVLPAVESVTKGFPAFPLEFDSLRLGKASLADFVSDGVVVYVASAKELESLRRLRASIRSEIK